MPYRRINTSRWGEAWFEGLTAPEKLIYIYLESNDRCPACGIYQVTLKRIASETDLPISQVEKAVCHGLQPFVLYDRHINLVFIRRFVKDQRCAPKWMISVDRTLNDLEPHPFIKEFLQENHMFEISYKYDMDSISIDTVTVTDTGSETLNLLGEGSKEGENQPEINLVDENRPARDPQPMESQLIEKRDSEEPEAQRQFHDWVYMPESKYQELISKYGQARTDLDILKLDNYLEQNEALRLGASKKAYVNHFKVIGTWIESDNQKQKGKGGKHGKAKGEPDYSIARAAAAAKRKEREQAHGKGS